MKLRDRLRGAIPDEDLQKLSNRFSLIGDVAVISLRPELVKYRWEIAQTLVSSHSNIRAVLNKTEKVHGDRRVAAFELLAGKDAVTTHREHGFVYHLDVARVFFNSRLAYERRRVATNIRPGELLLVPFCGVGPFAVPAAAAGARVVALEKSREACRWLAENARHNGVQENIIIAEADAFQASKMLKPVFDRAIVPTPYGQDEILDTIQSVVRNGGTIHFYTFKKRFQIEGLVENFMERGLNVRFFRRCGNVAPGVSRYVFDMVKR